MVIFRANARQIKLNNLVVPLLFGHYGWLKDWQGQKVEVAGSGIFVADGIGLGAKHVSKGIEKLDDRIEAAQRRSPVFADQYRPLPIVTQYAGLLYQAPTVRFPEQKDISYWGVLADWPSPDTDITTLEAEAVSEAAKNAAAAGMTFMEWQLLPPERGAEVEVFGFPKAKITVDTGFHVADIRLESVPVRVVKVFDVLQAHGFTRFPGFEVDRDLAHGFSGGAAIYDGRFVGIFSGPNYISSLWPLMIHRYVVREDNPDVDLMSPGKPVKPIVTRPFTDLFTTGRIYAIDFDDVNGRVRRAPCEEALRGSEIESRCDKEHVILAR